MKEKLSSEQLFEAIRQADRELLEEIMREISLRYRRDFPDWDVIYLAIPKGDAQKRAETLRWLEKHGVWD